MRVRQAVKKDEPNLRQQAVEDHPGYILSLLADLLHPAVEESLRGLMDGAFDMPACVVFASHINDSEILAWHFALGLHHSGELLFVILGISPCIPEGGYNKDADGDVPVRI